MKNSAEQDYCLGVIGAGAMGQGIAQVALQGGLRVLWYDAKEGGAEAGRNAVFGRLERLVEKGKLTETDVENARQNLSAQSDLGSFSACDAIVEAVFEDLQIKQDLFSELENIVADDCVLASNTSSILIASIARVLTRPERFGGLHFFNPVPLMRLVEVIRGPATNDETVKILKLIGERLGRTPVVAKDAPGFLVNHGGRAFTTEGMRLLHEGVGMPAQIDAIMRDCAGFRMGPCELMDLTGVDVNYPVTQIVYEGYDHDPRLKTSFPHKALLEAGTYGRKTGAGNYTYDGDGKISGENSGDHESGADAATSVFMPEKSDELSELLKEASIDELPKDDGKAPILVPLIGEDCSTYAERTGTDYRRLVAIDLVFAGSRLTLMQSPGAKKTNLDSVAAAFQTAGRSVTAINDSPGFVAQRMCAMVANLGCEMAQIGLASPADIDTAMKMGLNYPSGPLELVEKIGAGQTREILEQLQAITGEDRYRPSLWLRRRAQLGLPIHDGGTA